MRTYLDWMLSLPWNVVTGSEIDIHHARAVLDADHYDLDKVNDRILEHLAERASGPSGDGVVPTGDPGGGRAGTYPLFGRPPRSRQDFSGAVDCQGAQAQVHPHVPGRCTR